MLDKNTLIKVMNRDNGTVGYTVPDLGNLHRNFQPGEIKEVTMEELRKLSYLPGGKNLIQNYLLIQNKEALTELLPSVEPEYFYTEEEVKQLLLNGTQDQFMDCLDFAPEGVIELVKKFAVELEINDLAKRKAILDKTGFNVSKAIQINKESKEDDEGTEEKAGGRRATPIITESNHSETPVRRTSPTSKYKVVTKVD